MSFSSACKVFVFRSFTISTALLPYRSLIFLSAPLISNYLTILVFLVISQLYTARCNGVMPIWSCPFRSDPHAIRNCMQLSDDFAQAQWSGVAPHLSFMRHISLTDDLVSLSYISFKKASTAGESPYEAAWNKVMPDLVMRLNLISEIPCENRYLSRSRFPLNAAKWREVKPYSPVAGSIIHCMSFWLAYFSEFYGSLSEI
jgi:hypothetical protein